MTGNDVTWPKVIGGDLKVTSFYWKWLGKGCRRLKIRILVAFQLLQGCNTEEVKVM